jgi:hypothetical protein
LTTLLVGDSELFDNRAFHAAPPRQTLRVSYVGNENADDPNTQLFFLHRAFPESSILAVKVDSRLPNSGRPFDANLTILNSLTAADATLLKTNLETGGTALLILGQGADLSSLNRLNGAPPPSVTEVGANFVLLANVDFEHPLFSQFRDARFNDFTRIHFWKHRKLDASQIPNARVLATFDDSTPALVQVPLGKGALYILTSGWTPADSQFALSSKFVPILYSLLEQSAPISVQARQLTIGDSIPFPGDFTGDSIALSKPDGAIVQWKKGEAFSGTDQPGFYSSEKPNLIFAVNLDPSESRTAPIPEDQFASLGLPLKHEESAVSATEKKQHEQLLLATEQESRQKLWRRLLIAALAILLVEAVVARISSTRSPLAKAG